MKYLFRLLFLSVAVSASLYAQKDTIYVSDIYDPGGKEGTLNDSVQALMDRGGNFSNTVFKLKTYGLYVLTGGIIFPSEYAGVVFELYADPPGNIQETAPPMICWTEDTAPSKTFMFDVPGEVKMTNIWLLWSGKNGTRFPSTIRIGDSATISAGRCEFTNVMFDYVNQNSSGAVQPYASHFKGYFKNCYFRNCTDRHFRYYSRALSWPYDTKGLHNDTVSFENCTFANMGYVYMQELNEYADNVYFNHCTFFDVVVFSLESGSWWKMHVTNSMFVNTFMFAATPANDRQGFGGTISIATPDSFGFVPPFTEQERCILFANNSYYIEQWLIDWMGYGPNGSPYSKYQHSQRDNDMVPVPMPMLSDGTIAYFDSLDAEGHKAFPFVNKANLYDGISITPTCSVWSGENYTYPIVAARTEYDPRLFVEPIALDSLKSFLNRKWDDNSDCEWAWRADSSFMSQKWPMMENLAYQNDTLKHAAMGEFPLGDLYHWWPTEYANWKTQAADEHTRIMTWMETGIDPALSVEKQPGIPTGYELGQNYPNPFNPTTRIEYSILTKGFVSLKVYNMLGQEVATLFNGVQNAGNYVATFNASGLASGVYLYQLKSGNVSLTKKLVLVK
jgi:hypothetical protein